MKSNTEILDEVIKEHGIMCKDIRTLGKEPFCWIFKYGEVKTDAEAHDKGILGRLLKEPIELDKNNEPKVMFKIMTNGPTKKEWNGFNIEFKK